MYRSFFKTYMLKTNFLFLKGLHSPCVAVTTITVFPVVMCDEYLSPLIFLIKSIMFKMTWSLTNFI